jgi:nucleotide-binding universal stress UspA family protein
VGRTSIPKIAALVDGSLYSRSVCDNAAWIAHRSGADVELMHVLGRRHPAGPTNLSGSISLGARSALLEELAAHDEQAAKLAQRHGRAILEDAQAHLAEAGVTATTRLRLGDLLEAVAEHDADMIVIGKRGEAADFAKLHLGSNLERVARTWPKPLFVAARAFRPIKRFLIAFDGGPSSLRALDYVASSPLFSDTEGHILMAAPDSDKNRKALDKAAAALNGAGTTVETSLVSGQVDTVIAAAVDALEIDLLVMGAYGHSRIRNMIIGSTTSEMLRSCKVPVVLLR